MALCRFCGADLKVLFADLGVTPLSNAFLKPSQLNQMEPFFPLHVFVCESCFLVQLEEFETPQKIFGDYAYFSSFSEAWLKHAETYAHSMISRFNLDKNSHVVEIASNDGYLLQYFKKRGLPILGIEPAKNVAHVAEEKGIPTLVKFFGAKTAGELAEQGTKADLLIGNNVLAHVPNLNDFVAGLKIILKSDGILTVEFPHVLKLIADHQFDTIYHEHFSYFSLFVVEKIFRKHGLAIFDVEELPTHGGSLRFFVSHAENNQHKITTRVLEIKEKEKAAGLNNLETYEAFVRKILETKYALLEFLIGAKRQGKRIVGYGAPAKGNTLLNFCGIGRDFIDFTVDRNVHKQNHYLPGSHIPIFHPDKIRESKPDYVLILPWNLKEEIMDQMKFIRDFGGKFVVPIPSVAVL